ncbi:hypothetical protein C2G38_855246 [Gigaspora rosea]|uniref:Uncharacterized protein n=1 Tax=Gigaspora rosea TaxID=44941 RepID=A0A397VQA1_9GLOM|nr:hypothetical protein C2G38_855246 [Gigaspora rosea]
MYKFTDCIHYYAKNLQFSLEFGFLLTLNHICKNRAFIKLVSTFLRFQLEINLGDVSEVSSKLNSTR